MGSRQHSKGKQRPRAWHHGRAEGRKARAPIADLEHAEQRSRTADDELRSVAARYSEEIEVWSGVCAAAPFVPRLEAGL